MAVLDDSEIKSEFLGKLEEVKALGLADRSYVIWGRGPLAVRGLGEVEDVDLLVTQNVWDELSRVYPIEDKRIVVGGISVWKDCMNLNDQMILDADWIEGLPFMKLSYLRQWKASLGNEKDLADVELIDQYLFAALSPL